MSPIIKPVNTGQNHGTRKHTLAASIALALGCTATSATGALPTNTTLDFTDGQIVCLIAGTPPNNCQFGLTDVVGSYFGMDTDGGGIGPTEKTAIAKNNGLIIGVLQPASGSHLGLPGCVPSPTCGDTIPSSEAPDIDEPWGFFGNTGMHETKSAVTVAVDNGASQDLDFSGWYVDWNGVEVPMGGDTANFPADTGIGTITCAVDCSNGDSFTLDYNAHVPVGDASGFGGVFYALHMEGSISLPGSPPTTQPDSATTIVGNLINIDVLANDSSADGLKLSSVTITTPASPGLATPNTTDGTVDYDPQTAIGGDSDTFDYTVDSNLDITSNPTKVDIAIQTNVAPVAVDDSLATNTANLNNSGGSIVIDILANDTDANNAPGLPGGIDVTTVTVTGQPATGTCTKNANGTITYSQTPPSVATIGDSCTYTVQDIDITGALTSNTGTINIDISGIQSDWPSALDPDIIPVLQFDPGVPDPSGDTSRLPASGTYFSMAVSANTTIYTTMKPGTDGGVVVGYDQISGLSHTGSPTGNEIGVLDQPWIFFGNTGMSFTKNGGITGNTDGTLKFDGDPAVNNGQGKYQITWNGIPEIDLGGSTAFPQDLGFGVIHCDTKTPVNPANTATCQNGDFFTLVYDAHVPPGDPSGFGGVPYGLRMTGKVGFIDGTLQASEGSVVSSRLAISDVPADPDVQLQCAGGCFDYTVTGVTPGASVSVVIPLAGGVPVSTVDGNGITVTPELRVLRNNTWGSFVTNATDSVKSAQLIAGGTFGLQCPPPGNAGYGPLTAGHQCIEVTMQDNNGANNAPNDKDPTPGTVADPSGIGLPAGAAFVDNRTSGSDNGCTMSSNTSSPLNGGAWWLLSGIFAWFGWNRRKSSQKQ